MKVFVVGLTGGIGSGKTAVTRCFETLGVLVIDADIVAREVVAARTPALQAIAARHGQTILLDDGNLNRAKLREIVFKDPGERRWLEQLTHPLIREGIIHGLQNAKAPYSILVSPLLIESGQAQLCQRILVVDVSRDTQIERTMQRDHNNRQQVEAIINAQISREQRLAHADDVINNEADLALLADTITKLHQTYLILSKQHDS
ncbi:MAG: dephospho-CoA kinase [Oceanospirillaceae bacterium]|nr:dephospho-CoA kinase [Oceanospirillaceae bacterium]MCP5351111.1 dephospho-CoA kinase [Oceanospirillaceae bacterium]